MSESPLSVRVCIRMEVPRKPVWRQLPWSAKFLRSRASIASFALPSTRPFFRANRTGVCIVFRMASLKVPSGRRKRARI